MRSLLAALLLLLVLVTPVTAQTLDVCPNLDGIQSEVPDGYRLVLNQHDPLGDPECILKGRGSAH